MCIVTARVKYKSNIIMYLIKKKKSNFKADQKYNANKLIKSTANKTKCNCNLKDNCFSREIRNGGISVGKFAEKYWRENAWSTSVSHTLK